MACLPLSGSGAFLGATLVSTGEEEQPIRSVPAEQSKNFSSTSTVRRGGRTCQHKTMRFDGKTSIITGASRGIGRAIALRLAAEGSQVVLSARDEHALEDATGEIRKAGGAAHTIALDLRAPSAAGRLAEFTMSRCGRIDCW